MRLEATVPDNRGSAAVKLADELGLSRSQLIDEALSLFLKAVLEVKRGRRLVTLDPATAQPACELATPTLTALEWAHDPAKIHATPTEMNAMQRLVESPPTPSPRLKGAAKRHRK